MPRKSIITAPGFESSYVPLKEVLTKHPEWVTDLVSDIVSGLSGVTTVDSLPETGEEGRIYHNSNDGNYYTYSEDGFEPIRTPGIEIVDDATPVTLPEIEPGVSYAGEAYEIDPGKLYLFGDVETGLCLILKESSSSEALQYLCRFTATFGTGVDSFGIALKYDDADTTVTVPDNTIEIEDGHTYELNILHGVAMLADITSTPTNNG